MSRQVIAPTESAADPTFGWQRTNQARRSFGDCSLSSLERMVARGELEKRKVNGMAFYAVGKFFRENLEEAADA